MNSIYENCIICQKATETPEQLSSQRLCLGSGAAELPRAGLEGHAGERTSSSNGVIGGQQRCPPAEESVAGYLRTDVGLQELGEQAVFHS